MIKAMTAREYTDQYKANQESKKMCDARRYAGDFLSPKIHNASCSGQEEVVCNAGSVDRGYLQSYLEGLGYKVKFDNKYIIISW